MKMLKFFFIGWGKNGEKCLQNLIRNYHVPQHIFVPKNYPVDNMIGLAKQKNIPIDELEKNDSQLFVQLTKKSPQLLIIASFPYLLSEKVTSLPQFGTINVHAAKLPAYRGYHPLNWAMIKDEPEIGVTVHYVGKGMDDGDILAQHIIPISNVDDINTVVEKTTSSGAKLLLSVISKFEAQQQKLQGIPQNQAQASFAPRRYPEDGVIDWRQNTRDIFNLIRSLKSPYPNAFCHNQKFEKIQITSSYVSKTPGTVLSKVGKQYVISTGDGVILVSTNKKLQPGDKLQ